MEKLVFVIMPFAQEFDWLFEDVCTVAGSLGAKTNRADDISAPRNVMSDVVNGILLSDVIVADITNGNANVLYELGAAHALMKRVILLTQDIASVPFNLRGYRVVGYSSSGREAFRCELRKYFEEAVASPVEPENPIAQSYTMPFRARILRAHGVLRPAGEIGIYRSVDMAVVVVCGNPIEGLVHESSYGVKSVHWGASGTGWGWDGNDHVSAPYKAGENCILGSIRPTFRGDLRGTPYIRTLHNELIYFDLLRWRIRPQAALQITDNAGHQSAILECPLDSLPPYSP